MTKKKRAKIIKNILLRLFFMILLFTIIIISVNFYFSQKPNLAADNPKEESETKDTHIEFLLEIQEKIKEYYWEEISDEAILELYELALEKATEQIGGNATTTEETDSPIVVMADENELENLLSKKLKNLDPETKKELTVNIASLVLSNLKPFGRSGLYTDQKVQELSDTVNNIDPETNLYQELELEEDATQEEIDNAHKEKSKELEKIIQDEDKNDEEKEKARNQLAQLDRAKDTLADPKKRETYDDSGVESTANSNILSPGIAYVQIKKFSPTTFEEFVNELDLLEDEPELETLILDLRDNIGGSIDYLPYFMGIFLGDNQYAYDWFHQEEYTPFRTKNKKMPVINKVKRIIILANGVTQSSAELMISTLKRYNLGIFVGTRTKGWGTIEKVYPLETQIDPEKETYSIFLVHSVTLRENDGQPIEGRGVDPDIDVTSEDWQDQLTDYFEDEELTEIISELVK